MKKFDYIIYIGRFQPPHWGHINTISDALELSKKVIILAGSANQPRTIKNPFTFDEREQMLRSPFTTDIQNQIIIHPLEDAPYNNQVWARWVQTEVEKVIDVDDWGGLPTTKRVGIIGYVKDGSSFYLSMFPQWEFVPVENYGGLNATNIREAYFECSDWGQVSKASLPKDIENWLLNFKKAKSKEYKNLQDEYNYIKKYKSAWDNSPYPPTFVTVDAVVIQSGHVLMVRRGAMPGMNQLALPGGFLNPEETTESAMLRELREETKLKVPEPVLRGSIKASKLFDNPNRSLRGRTLTNAFLIELAPGELPKVKGGDDAKKAMWIPLADLSKMKDQCFEDHYFIINHFLGRV